jgi:hypothetical protein
MKRSFRMVVAAAAATAVFATTGPHVIFASRAQASRPVAQAVAPAKPAAEKARLAARADALDDWVTALTAEMNKATGQAKIDAMARVLTALVQHRTMMLDEIKMMQDDLDAQHEMITQMVHRGARTPAPAPK